MKKIVALLMAMLMLASGFAFAEEAPAEPALTKEELEAKKADLE